MSDAATTDEVVTNSAPRRIAAVITHFMCLGFGIANGIAILLAWQNYYPYPQFQITPSQISATVIEEEIPPMWAILRFAGPAEFSIRSPSKNTQAYAWDGPYNCKITLKSGTRLRIYPKGANINNALYPARFMDDGVLADTIAHELAHCLNGAWHP